MFVYLHFVGPLQNDIAKDFKLNQFKELREELFEGKIEREMEDSK